MPFEEISLEINLWELILLKKTRYFRNGFHFAPLLEKVTILKRWFLTQSFGN